MITSEWGLLLFASFKIFRRCLSTMFLNKFLRWLIEFDLVYQWRLFNLILFNKPNRRHLHVRRICPRRRVKTAVCLWYIRYVIGRRQLLTIGQCDTIQHWYLFGVLGNGVDGWPVLKIDPVKPGLSVSLYVLRVRMDSPRTVLAAVVGLRCRLQTPAVGAPVIRWVQVVCVGDILVVVATVVIGRVAPSVLAQELVIG